MQLIIVDDDKFSLEIMGVVVRALGWPEPSTWQSTSKALRAFKRRPGLYRGAVLDIVMPHQLDGFAVAERLRVISPDLPIFFYTAYPFEAAPDVPDLVRALGNCTYFEKPLTAAELRDAIERFFVGGVS